MKKTKILFIHHGIGVGGAPINLVNIILGLSKERYQCKVALIKGGKAEELFNDKGIETEIIDGSNIYFMHNESGKISFYYFIRYFKIIFFWFKTAFFSAPEYLEKQDFDIIHLGSHGLTSWAYAAKKLGFKVVMHNQETVTKGYMGIRLFILRKLIDSSTDIIINISKDNESRLGLVYKSRIVYNFVKIPKSYRLPFSQEDKIIKVLYLGGMSKIKGFEASVKCLKYLNPNIRIQFAGNIGKIYSGGGIEGFFKNIIKKTIYSKRYTPLRIIDKASNSELIGLVNDPLTYIDQCDILISPFKIDHFSRPIIEAFAFGKPVIASDLKGMDEVVNHGVNGILIKKDNPAELAQAINELCQNRTKAINMGENGREKAKLLFSQSVNIKKIENIYNNLN